MIDYNCMSEAWEDSEDPKFKVSMTPEGDGEEFELTFETQTEFYKWYYEPSKDGGNKYDGMLQIIYHSTGHVVSDENVETWAEQVVSIFNNGNDGGLVISIGAEVMLYKIRVLVKKGVLKSEDVCVFFPRTGNMEPEFIDSNGRMTDYPVRAFEKLLDDLLED